jgi:hypothetical protein
VVDEKGSLLNGDADGFLRASSRGLLFDLLAVVQTIEICNHRFGIRQRLLAISLWLE